LRNWRWCFDGRIFLADAYIVLPGADGNNPKSAKVSNKRGLSLGISDLLLSLLLSTKITENVSSPYIDLSTDIVLYCCPHGMDLFSGSGSLRLTGPGLTASENTTEFDK
jgi:hypothetical protein